MNLAIFTMFLAIIYVYINKYCTQTSATQCSNDFMRSFFNVGMYLSKLSLKFLSAAFTIVRENPYNADGSPPLPPPPPSPAKTAFVAK